MAKVVYEGKVYVRPAERGVVIKEPEKALVDGAAGVTGDVYYLDELAAVAAFGLWEQGKPMDGDARLRIVIERVDEAAVTESTADLLAAAQNANTRLTADLQTLQAENIELARAILRLLARNSALTQSLQKVAQAQDLAVGVDVAAEFDPTPYGTLAQGNVIGPANKWHILREGRPLCGHPGDVIPLRIGVHPQASQLCLKCEKKQPTVLISLGEWISLIEDALYDANNNYAYDRPAESMLDIWRIACTSLLCLEQGVMIKGVGDE